MRVIALGTGMPMPRLKQAAACFLIELGNGDKFIFDMGNGSFERIHALGISLDYLDKVFITHPHMDHMADLATFYMTGPQSNRSVPLRGMGSGRWRHASGVEFQGLRWTTWRRCGPGCLVLLAGTIDTTAFKLEVTEYDWSKVNNVIYEDNGVVIKSLPAIHFEGTASFILEWNGLRLAFSGDTLPNKWWIEHTKGVDLSIHECFLYARIGNVKVGFLQSRGLERSDDNPCKPLLFRKGNGHDET